MLKKLTEEKLAEILETGITEFAANGPDRANINVIAKKAGISVGVLYKYYGGKEAFWQACLRRSLDALDAVLRELTGREEKLLRCAEQVIRAVQRYAREHGDYIRLYHRITADGGANAATLAAEIEGVTARTYTRFIAQARETGAVRRDIDPRLFAFFFDNLLMMMQFSYSCDYYRARFQIYCGADILEDDERVVHELLKFFESAFTLEQSAIAHSF